MIYIYIYTVYCNKCYTVCFLCPAELDHRGWKITDIILIHLYVSSMEEYGPLNTVYKKHFGINPPAR